MPRINPPSEHDYAAIEAAVMETERGRWFLAEHAARHRVADTETILAAIGRMGAATPALPPPAAGALRDIGTILATARAAARGNAPESRPPHLRPMQVADGAITAVRRVAEKIHEVAFELRENARVPLYADALDVYCRDLDSASSLQEQAILQLAELAGVVDAIEEKLATLVAALPGSVPQSTAAVPLPAPAAEPASDAPVSPVIAVPPTPFAIEAPPIQPATVPEPTAPTPARQPPRRTLLLVQPGGSKR